MADVPYQYRSTTARTSDEKMPSTIMLPSLVVCPSGHGTTRGTAGASVGGAGRASGVVQHPDRLHARWSPTRRERGIESGGATATRRRLEASSHTPQDQNRRAGGHEPHDPCLATVAPLRGWTDRTCRASRPPRR